MRTREEMVEYFKKKAQSYYEKAKAVTKDDDVSEAYFEGRAEAYEHAAVELERFLVQV